MNTYTTVSGTEPDSDEQHEARTIRRDRQEGSYMMTEIGDGVFVQWSTCTACKNQVEECKCPTGPAEPGYIHRWRINRFAESFAGRGVDPALPVVLRDRDRRVNAVTRYLLAQGFTITAPESKLEVPAFDEADYDSPTPDVDDERDFETAPGEEAYDQDYADRRDVEDAATDVVSEKVDAGMDNALETLRARAQEDKTDVGF